MKRKVNTILSAAVRISEMIQLAFFEGLKQEISELSKYCNIRILSSDMNDKDISEGFCYPGCDDIMYPTEDREQSER